MRWIASVAGVGYLRPAPGTWGALAALPLAYVIAALGGVTLFCIAILAVCALGWWATHAVTAGAEDHDPSWIVIDEVAGQWIALLPVIYGAGMMGVSLERLYPGWISAFVLFRLFDIWKPWLVGKADRMGGAWGVMLDDIIAGLFAAFVTVALAALAHGVLL